jgi:hypothetical protein
MSYPLHDFRIENENLILLWFTNGTSARVRPGDLANYLSKPDLDKVDKAMHQRRKFIKRVLPPTALFMLAGCVVTFAAHDAQQLMHRLQPAQPPAQEHLLTPQLEPAQPLPSWGVDYRFNSQSSPYSQSSASTPAASPLPAPAAEAQSKNQVQSRAAEHSRSQSAVKSK